MASHTIYLQAPSLSTLCHEAAHAHHYELHENGQHSFSQKWREQVGIERKEDESWDSPDLELREGLVRPYAAFDYLQDERSKPVNIPSSVSKRIALPFTVWGISISVCETIGNPEETAYMVVEDTYHLPEELGNYVTKVVIDPNLNYRGLHAGEGQVLEYTNMMRITEDVACHTQAFFSTYRDPKDNEKVLKLLKTHPKTQRKLDLLTIMGFLSDEIKENLANLEWLDHWLAQCEEAA